MKPMKRLEQQPTQGATDPAYIETAREDVSELESKLTAEQRAEGQRLATEWQAAFEKKR